MAKNCKICGKGIVQTSNRIPIVCSTYCGAVYQSEKRKGKEKKVIKKVSDKRKTQDKTYQLVRKAYLLKNPNCEVCGVDASEIHHKNGRTNERLIDSDYFLSVCRPCHNEIHANPEHARREGYLI